MKKYDCCMYLRYGSKIEGDYRAVYFRYKDSCRIMHFMYFNDPIDAVCWLFRKYIRLKQHTWGGGFVEKKKGGEVIYTISETRKQIELCDLSDLHQEYLNKWSKKK